MLIFIALASAVLRGGTQPFDDRIRLWVHAHASPALTLAMRGFSLIGEPVYVIAFGIVVVASLIRRKRAHTARLFFIVVFGAEVIDQLLKLIFHRARPTAFFGLPQPEGFSFPSGHSLVSCTFFLVLAAILASGLESPGRRALCYVAAVAAIGAIGLSRVYLGVHYPTDVLGGYAAAVAWVSGYALPGLRRTVPVTRDPEQLP